MLYTTVLTRITRGVDALGSVYNRCAFTTSKHDHLLNLRLTNEELEALLTQDVVDGSLAVAHSDLINEITPVALEEDQGHQVGCTVINRDQLLANIDFSKCPCCKVSLIQGRCQNDFCSGRRHYNFNKVLDILGIRREVNQGLFGRLSEPDVSKVFTELNFEESEDLMERQTQKLIDNARCLPFIVVNEVLGHLLDIDGVELYYDFFQKVESDLDWYRIVDLPTQKKEDRQFDTAIQRLSAYLDSPLADWLSHVDVVYR